MKTEIHPNPLTQNPCLLLLPISRDRFAFEDQCVREGRSPESSGQEIEVEHLDFTVNHRSSAVEGFFLKINSPQEQNK